MKVRVRKVKKNIRKIPDFIRKKLSTIDGDKIVPCYLLKADRELILAGKFIHLAICFEGERLSYPEELLPDPSQGKFSRWNVHGREVKRRDLPMEPFYIYIDAPNWGDYGNGTHTVTFLKWRYPVDYLPPRHIALRIQLLNEEAADRFLFGIVTSDVLSKGAEDFEERLFFALNLLQENLGGCDVAPSELNREDYLSHVVEWEILPFGNRDRVVKLLSEGQRDPVHARKTVEERYDFFVSLGARQMIYGTSGLQRYFGAKIEEDLVVFENLRYGNAVYIMYEDWEMLSQRSRTDLLSGRLGHNFDRIVHSGAWQNKVRRIVQDRQGRSDGVAQRT